LIKSDVNNKKVTKIDKNQENQKTPKSRKSEKVKKCKNQKIINHQKVKIENDQKSVKNHQK